MLADDHAFVDFHATRNDEVATLFEAPECVIGRNTGSVRDKHTVTTARDIAFVWHVTMEQAGQNTRTTRIGQELALIADHAACRDQELEANLATRGWAHVGHVTFTQGEFLDHDARERLIHVCLYFFNRLFCVAVLVLAEQNARTGNRQLVAFTAHGLDQNAQLQLAAAADFECVTRFGVLHGDRHVAFCFFVQTVADHTRGYFRAFGAREWGIVHRDGDRHRWWIDRGRFQCMRNFNRTDGICNGRVGQAGDGNDRTCSRFAYWHALDTVERQQLGDAALLDGGAVQTQGFHWHTDLCGAAFNFTGQDAAEEVVGLDEGGQHREICIRISIRCFYVAHHFVHDDVQVVWLWIREILHCPTVTAGSVDHWEVELCIVRVERNEQIEDFVQYFIHAAVRTVNFVDDDDRAQALGQCFHQYEFGLWHRAFCGIDENEYAVHHAQDTLYFTAEIGVAWRIDDVDAGVLPLDAGAFRENGNAALFLEVIAIHHALVHALVVAEGTCLAQHHVDKGGLAMIYVRNDGDVTKFGHRNLNRLGIKGANTRPLVRRNRAKISLWLVFSSAVGNLHTIVTLRVVCWGTDAAIPDRFRDDPQSAESGALRYCAA